MYRPSLEFDRTAEEKRDIFQSWARDDQAFFAAGGCHILADLFCQLHRDEGFKLIHIKPAKGFGGTHVYASNGEWVFDHNGWTREDELLQTTERAYTERYPGWSYERIEIEYTMQALNNLCAATQLRMPYHYPELPWKRAYNYINRFDPKPPQK